MHFCKKISESISRSVCLGMLEIENYVNSNLQPTEVTSSPWLYEHNPEIVQRYPVADGKWMLFCHKSQLNAMWDFAKTKYRSGQLEGITSMKVSTGYGNPRASKSDDGVILFYCGPSQDERLIMHYGQKLLEEIPYTSATGWVSYKSDEQTTAGTRATGQKKNYLYRLRCARY